MSNRMVSLRTHSWYSLLEGVSSPADLLACAAEQGVEALALTDCNLAGAVELVEAARGCSVRPILGARLRQGGQAATALIGEPAGYKSLCQILTRLNMQEGKVSLPLLLADASEGLHVLIDDANLLKPPITTLRGRLWLEVIRPARSDQHERALLEAGARLGCKPVASVNCHLARREDYRVYRLVTALRQGTTLDALPAKLPITAANHLADAGEMRERFRDLPNALNNAALLAESCRSDVLPRGQMPPPVRLPQGQEPLGHLRALCEQALVRRPPRDLLAARRRLEAELTLIADRDLAAYFLLVGEIGEEARRQGWPLAVRGSAAASLVLHLLGLGDVDPLAGAEGRALPAPGPRGPSRHRPRMRRLAAQGGVSVAAAAPRPRPRRPGWSHEALPGALFPEGGGAGKRLARGAGRGAGGVARPAGRQCSGRRAARCCPAGLAAGARYLAARAGRGAGAGRQAPRVDLSSLRHRAFRGGDRHADAF
jgi:error-prone DNA polymerase